MPGRFSGGRASKSILRCYLDPVESPEPKQSFIRWTACWNRWCGPIGPGPFGPTAGRIGPAGFHAGLIVPGPIGRRTDHPGHPNGCLGPFRPGPGPDPDRLGPVPGPYRPDADLAHFGLGHLGHLDPDHPGPADRFVDLQDHPVDPADSTVDWSFEIFLGFVCPIPPSKGNLFR